MGFPFVSVPDSLVLDTEGDIDRIRRRIQYVQCSSLLEFLRGQGGIRGRVDPFGFVVSGGQVQDQVFVILPRGYGIRATTATFTVMDVERILLAVLAHPAIVSLAVESAYDKASIRHHVVEAETFNKGLDTAKGAQKLGVLRRFSGRILSRKEPV